jgi:AcrR family transcriptional regulator
MMTNMTKNEVARGRPREFDLDAAVETAMQVFWRKGYEPTTMSDLVEAIGINRASLYAAFGDKETLFLLVLDRYRKAFSQRPVAALTEIADPREAIETFLLRTAEHLADERLPRGCLFANSILESPSGSERICRTIANGIADLEDAIYQVFQRGQREGQLGPGADCRALSRFYAGVAQGMALIAKVSADRSSIYDIARTSMAAWPSPAA